MAILEDALGLSPLGGGLWRGVSHPAYRGEAGLYGGLIAALLLKAVTSEPQSTGSPSALTVNFVRALPAGNEFVIRTRLLGGSRSIQTWTAELTIASSDEIYAAASIVLTARRTSDGFVELKMPDVPAPERVQAVAVPLPLGEQGSNRVALGIEFDNGPRFPGSSLARTHSVEWYREISGRKVDAVQIAFICDSFAPRAFFTQPGVRPSSTINYSVYFLSTPEEIETVGDDYVLLDAIGSRANQNTVGSRVNLWSRTGILLATSEQLSWFR